MPLQTGRTIEKTGQTKKVNFGIKLSKFLLKFGIDIRRKLFKQIYDQLGGKIRMVISGASSLDPKVCEGFKNFGIDVVQGYGLTETSPCVAAESLKALKSGSIGLPIPGIEMKIDNPNEEGIGELIVKGPVVMLGYYAVLTYLEDKSSLGPNMMVATIPCFYAVIINLILLSVEARLEHISE